MPFSHVHSQQNPISTLQTMIRPFAFSLQFPPHKMPPPLTHHHHRHHRRRHHLLLQFSTLSGPGPSPLTIKPKWNANHTLLITHPVLAKLEHSCSSMAHLKQIQAHMTRTGLISHPFPFSRLLAFSALADSGDFAHARRLFPLFPSPNTHMFNTMIRGHTSSASPHLGLSLFAQMVQNSIEMDNRTFVFALKACERLHCPKPFGEQVHSVLCKVGFESDLLVQNGLTHLYGKCGEMDCARKVFDGMCERDVVSWTTVIGGYSGMGAPDEALRMFYLMQGAGVRPNEVTMVSIVSACSQLGILSLGKSVHEFVEKSGLRVSVNLMNALVDMYGKCGCLDAAREVFDGMETRDVFSWTSLMNAYAKCGDLELAREVFDEMPGRNVISWSCMIAGYSQANQPKKALHLFHEMIAAGVKPIVATLVSVLSACAQNGCLELGRWIYTRYIHEERMNLSVKMANAFIDMYGKCGAIDDAVKLFNEMPERDVVSWNTMIMAFGIHGYGIRALNIFEQFKNTGMVPNDITFVGVLSACSHVGLVAEGRKHFEDMRTVYGIEPKAKHYACLIDLFGRVGLLEDAYKLARSMQMEPDEAAWGALLNACRMHGNIELGTCAGEKLLGLDPGDSGTYALLTNIYATRNRWDDVKRVKSLMRDRGVRKTPGCSSIEVEGKFHEFFAAGQSHFLSKDIYLTLSVLYMHIRWEGCVLDYEHCYSYIR